MWKYELDGDSKTAKAEVMKTWFDTVTMPAATAPAAS